MKKPILFILLGIALILISAHLMLRGTSVPQGSSPEFDESKVTKFVRLYLGLVNVSVENKEWKNEEWVINVSAKGFAGMDRFELRSDANLSSFKAFGIVNVPEAPPTYEELFGLGCQSNKSRIDVYVDPYDPWTYANFDRINEISDRFSESAVEKFHVVNPYTSKLEGYALAVISSKYLACAKKDSDSSFIKTAKCIFESTNKTKMVLNETELDGCIASAGLSMDNESFKTCLGNESIQLLTDDGNYELSQLGEITTSYVVIDCKYSTYPAYMDVVMCHVYPDMPACKEVS